MPDAPVPSDSNAALAPVPAPFVCSVVAGDPYVTCVNVTGELDIATACQLELRLRDAQMQTRLVVLDLGDLGFIDSAGVHAIINATIAAREHGRRLVVRPAPANVERLFMLTAALEQLERGDTPPAAVSQGAQEWRRGRSSCVSEGPDLRGAAALRST